ncbi:MAG: hypothetical protein AAGC77_03890 [Pseudomonadota bacterium]
MSKQFAAFHVTWRDASDAPLGLFADERALGKAAAAALQDQLNRLADEGWIIHDIFPASGVMPKHAAAFTIVAFR